MKKQYRLATFALSACLLTACGARETNATQNSEAESQTANTSNIDTEITPIAPKEITIDFTGVSEFHPEGTAAQPYSLEILSETYNNITFADEWYNASEDISLPMIGENWDCFYDENYTYQWEDGKLSIFDGENCLYVLEYPTDKWYVNGNNACLEDGIFYGASVMNGYAQPDSCFMFAYDLENEKLLWRSADQTYNSMNFLVKGDVIFCGYGFTAEDDYLYQLDKNTGEVIDRLSLKKMPDLMAEKDGRLYMLPTNFVLYTLITKEKWCSNKENFTFEEALRAVRECEEDPMISRDLFLQEGAICGGYSGEPEDNRLEQYIKIAEQLPQQAMFQTNDLLMREGKIPFNLECIGDMQQYLYKKSVWGEDAVYTGFPGAEGNGRIFIFVNCFAINSQSTHKEETWKFVESYFTEEGQKTIAPNWNFSILQDVLDQQLSDSRKQEYYQTSDGKREKLPILTYEIGGTYENVYAAKDEDIQDVREMINNTKVMQRRDLPFIGITQEETLYYFNGEKSIEETVAAIRNKIDEMPNANEGNVEELEIPYFSFTEENRR